MLEDFTKNVVTIIKSIPKGRVLSYGAIAKMAGNPSGARQVSWILHSMSDKHSLPWHRVINSKGRISLKQPFYDLQKKMLEEEGIEFLPGDKIDGLFFMRDISNNNEK